MSRSKPPGLPFACVRRPLFPQHVDDVILSDERLVAIPAPVTNLASQAFFGLVILRVPRSAHVRFMMGGLVHIGYEVGAFTEAAIDLWRNDDDLEPALQHVANDIFDSMIKTVREKAPGVIDSFFGDLFKPVKP